jgi:hypothetical protein
VRGRKSRQKGGWSERRRREYVIDVRCRKRATMHQYCSFHTTVTLSHLAPLSYSTCLSHCASAPSPPPPFFFVGLLPIRSEDYSRCCFKRTPRPSESQVCMERSVRHSAERLCREEGRWRRGNLISVSLSVLSVSHSFFPSSFFNRWYESLSSEPKAQFKSLIRSGQIEFVNGGWVQNDEANPDPTAMINQMATGHEYLLKNFGTSPRIAWQIGE